MTAHHAGHGNFLAAMFADPQVDALFSAPFMLAHFADFEAALVEALASHGAIDTALAQRAAQQIRAFRPDVGRIERALADDGIAIPEYLRQLRATMGDDHFAVVHRGATSQDVVDTTMAMVCRAANDIIMGRATALVEGVETLDVQFGHHPLMARTRMRAALPIRIADRLAVWQRGLASACDDLAHCRKRVEVLQFGGPVGLRHIPGVDSVETTARDLATRLGLGYTPHSWHTERAGPAGHAAALAALTGQLGRIGQDLVLMAQDGVGAVRLSGSGSSSAMPHKENPVRGELLIAAARHAVALSSGMQHTLMSEHERSGSMLALEWLTLPPLVSLTARSLTIARELLEQIKALGDNAGVANGQGRG